MVEARYQLDGECLLAWPCGGIQSGQMCQIFGDLATYGALENSALVVRETCASSLE